jgi:hypothetical protein
VFPFSGSMLLSGEAQRTGPRVPMTGCPAKTLFWSKSRGRAPAVHELQYVSGHELYMRRLVLMGPCAGGVFGEAQRHAPCVGSGRFQVAPENPAWPARGGHRVGHPASFDIGLYMWRTSLSVQGHMQVHRSAAVHAVSSHVHCRVRRGLLVLVWGVVDPRSAGVGAFGQESYCRHRYVIMRIYSQYD